MEITESCNGEGKKVFSACFRSNILMCPYLESIPKAVCPFQPAQQRGESSFFPAAAKYFGDSSTTYQETTLFITTFSNVIVLCLCVVLPGWKQKSKRGWDLIMKGMTETMSSGPAKRHPGGSF